MRCFIDDNTIAVLAMMVTSKEKSNPFCVKIDDWKDAGLKVESWARIDRIISMDEWRMNRKIGNLSEKDLRKFMELIVEFIFRVLMFYRVRSSGSLLAKLLQLLHTGVLHVPSIQLRSGLPFLLHSHQQMPSVVALAS